MEETTRLKTFNYQEDGTVSFSILSTVETTDKLKSGVYNINTEQHFQKGFITNLSCLLDQETYKTEIPFYFKNKLDKIFNSFYNAEIKDKINSLGYKHKIGILLHGKQGTGKTSLVRDYFNNTIDCCNSIVFNINRTEHFNKTWEFIQNIRKIQNNPIVVFLDECDSLFTGAFNQENTVKKILDGIDSIDNCMILMATNYIDKIPDTIKNRPSRVKYIIEVEGLQETCIIDKFLQESFDKINIKYDYSKDLNTLKGSTIDELKEYVLNVIMDLSEEKVIKKSIGFSR